MTLGQDGPGVTSSRGQDDADAIARLGAIGLEQVPGGAFLMGYLAAETFGAGGGTRRRTVTYLGGGRVDAGGGLFDLAVPTPGEAPSPW